MGDSHDSPSIPKLITMFYFVGGVLVLGTLITVLIDVMFALPLPWAAFIGLSIALVKASFVVAIFMHYKWDAKLKMITWVMIVTFFFFAGMMGLIMWAEGDMPHLRRDMLPSIFPIAAALLGIALPAAFTILVIKLLNQPAVEGEAAIEPNTKATTTRSRAKRSVKKK